MVELVEHRSLAENVVSWSLRGWEGARVTYDEWRQRAIAQTSESAYRSLLVERLPPLVWFSMPCHDDDSPVPS